MQKELVELLLEGKLQEFEERFQSFIDQIPKSKGVSSAPGQKDFFKAYHLGMFASLKNTQIYDKLGISEINCKFDDSNNLHVVIERKDKKVDKQQIFVFTSNEKANIDGVLKSQKSNYGGDVCIVNVKEGKVKVGSSLGSSLNNSYRIGSDFIKIPKIDKDHKGNSYGKLESYISDISNKNLPNEEKRKILDGLLNYNTELYKEIRKALPNNKGTLFNTEAFQHGFLAGGLMNFRYSDNLKTNIELILGQGYVDMMLLVRGEDRSQSALPVIIELKKSSDNNALPKALQEAEWYAKGLLSNKMRMITNSENVICAGLDLNGQGARSSIKEIKTLNEPFLQTLLVQVDNNNIDEIRSLLSEVHYSFPGTESLYDYLNNFILGQLLIINEVNVKEIKIKGIFKYNNKPHLTTFTFQVGDKLLVLNIDSRGKVSTRQKAKKEVKQAALPIVKREGTIASIIEVDISSAYDKSKFSPRSHFHESGAVIVQSISRQDYLLREDALGDFHTVNSSVEKLKAEFDDAVDYQHGRLGELVGENLPGVKENSVEMGGYKRFFNTISEEIFRNKAYFLNGSFKEYKFKALLDGILTGLSNIRYNRDKLMVIVPTEFQVGEGGRVDIAVQTIDKNGKHGTPVLIELKTAVPLGIKLLCSFALLKSVSNSCNIKHSP